MDSSSDDCSSSTLLPGLRKRWSWKIKNSVNLSVLGDSNIIYTKLTWKFYVGIFYEWPLMFSTFHRSFDLQETIRK